MEYSCVENITHIMYTMKTMLNYFDMVLVTHIPQISTHVLHIFLLNKAFQTYNNNRNEK